MYVWLTLKLLNYYFRTFFINIIYLLFLFHIELILYAMFEYGQKFVHFASMQLYIIPVHGSEGRVGGDLLFVVT